MAYGLLSIAHGLWPTAQSSESGPAVHAYPHLPGASGKPGGAARAGPDRTGPGRFGPGRRSPDPLRTLQALASDPDPAGGPPSHRPAPVPHGLGPTARAQAARRRRGGPDSDPARAARETSVAPVAGGRPPANPAVPDDSDVAWAGQAPAHAARPGGGESDGGHGDGPAGWASEADAATLAAAADWIRGAIDSGGLFEPLA
jgi:hypothetical protein